MDKKKAIFIDFNGTISNSVFWEHLQFSEKENERELYANLVETLFKDNKEYINDWMRGKYSTEDVVKDISMKTEADYNFLLEEFIKSCKS
ncbi:MAG TPA: hypothetical protein VHA74_02755, partial [Candidatus Dojkabacteria bacterium]|nr:hypothetical protein [Candidatus Dojkabacteria bacterium]